MWNNRAMSNRYWISVAAVAVAAAVAGIYVARMVANPQCRRSSRARLLPHSEDARALQSGRHARRAGFARNTARPSDAGVLRFHALPGRVPDHARAARERAEAGGDARASRWRSSASIRSATRRNSSANTSRHSAAILSASRAARLKLSKSHDELRRRGEPRRSPGGGYTMDHSATVFALDSSARIVAVFTPPFNAAALARDIARLAPVLGERRMTEPMSEPRRRRARVRRAPAPAAATRHLAPRARRHAFALAGVQERADPAVRARLQARHVRRGGNRTHRLRELQRILHARAASRARARWTRTRAPSSRRSTAR